MTCTVRAGYYTVSTSYASFIVDMDYTIWSLVDGLGWTHSHARRIVTMHTLSLYEVPLQTVTIIVEMEAYVGIGVRGHFVWVGPLGA